MYTKLTIYAVFCRKYADFLIVQSLTKPIGKLNFVYNLAKYLSKVDSSVMLYQNILKCIGYKNVKEYLNTYPSIQVHFLRLTAYSLEMR